MPAKNDRSRHADTRRPLVRCEIAPQIPEPPGCRAERAAFRPQASRQRNIRPQKIASDCRRSGGIRFVRLVAERFVRPVLPRTAESGAAAGRGTHHPELLRIARLLHAVVVPDVARTLLAEMAQVVGELHHVVTADHAVGGILRPSRSGRPYESPVLVQQVVDAHHDFAAPVAEDFFADIDVAQHVGVVVTVREADVLRVGGTGREGESERQHELHVPLGAPCRCRSTRR